MNNIPINLEVDHTNFYQRMNGSSHVWEYCSGCETSQLRPKCHLCDKGVCWTCDIKQNNRMYGLALCHATDCRKPTCWSCIKACSGCGYEVCKTCYRGICLGKMVPNTFVWGSSIHVPRHESMHKLYRPFFNDCDVIFQ